MMTPSYQELLEGMKHGAEAETTIVFTTDDAVVNSAEESEASPIKHQDDDSFLKLEGLVHHRFLLQGQKMNQAVYAFEVQSVGNGLANGLPVQGFCITATRHGMQ
jgi:hypothetical protein